MPKIVHLDFETRSELSVKEVGAWVYSRHPSTDIMCLAYAEDNEPVQLLTREELDADDSFFKKVNAWLADPDVVFKAHNALFEQCVWRNIMVEKYYYRTIPIRRWRCTAAKAANKALPRDLEGVGKALNLPIQKSEEGHKVMMKLSKPKRPTKLCQDKFYTPEKYPELFEQLYEYCKTDVETERLVDKALPNLTKREQEIWFVDQEINMRGLAVDVAAVNRILEFLEITTKQLTEKFRELTDEFVQSPNQWARLLEWVKNEGVEMPNMQAATVDKFLKINIPQHVKDALAIRRELSKISTAKYMAILARLDPEDHHVRDLLLYCAALTRRWGGRGVQPQNLPRGVTDSDRAIETILLDGYDWFTSVYDNPMAVYSSCVRGAFVAPPGYDLIVSDLSSIEAMVLPWLAGDESALDVFREERDPYCEEASSIFGFKVTGKDKYERSVGKVAVLALGYEGGIGAFGTMARGYGVDLAPAYNALWPTATENERQLARNSYELYLRRCEKNKDPDPLDRASGYAADIIKQRWRAKNKLIKKLWGELNNAAIQAVLTGDKISVEINEWVNPISYGVWGSFLLCQLPSGDSISYPFPKISNTETPWGEKKYTLTYRTVDSTTYQYHRTSTYGGKLAENVTQAVARDVLADALVKCEKRNYPVVLHVHDEIVSRVPEGTGSVTEHESIMAEIPFWGIGLPLKAKGWRGKRYKK